LALYGAIAIAIVAFAVVNAWSSFMFQFPNDAALRLEYLKFVLEIYKTIGIGFLIAILGIIIPHVLAETKYLFERAKEARSAYSKAKTGIEYLPYELATLEYESAISHIKIVHQEKHLAEAYKENKEHRGKFKGEFYYKLDTYREVIGKHCEQWDSLSKHERHQLLQESKDSEAQGKHNTGRGQA